MMTSLYFPARIDTATHRVAAPIKMPAAPWIILDDRMSETSPLEWREIVPAHVAYATLKGGAA